MAKKLKTLAVVLISVDAFSNGRKIAENIENQTFKTTEDLLETIRQAEDLKKEDVLVQVLALTDYMDSCNNQEIELESEWVSYVYIEEKIR